MRIKPNQPCLLVSDSIPSATLEVAAGRAPPLVRSGMVVTTVCYLGDVYDPVWDIEVPDAWACEAPSVVGLIWASARCLVPLSDPDSLPVDTSEALKGPAMASKDLGKGVLGVNAFEDRHGPFLAADGAPKTLSDPSLVVFKAPGAL